MIFLFLTQPSSFCVIPIFYNPDIPFLLLKQYKVRKLKKVSRFCKVAEGGLFEIVSNQKIMRSHIRWRRNSLMMVNRWSDFENLKIVKKKKRSLTHEATKSTKIHQEESHLREPSLLRVFV
jgi:hypothetical protein